MDNFEMNTADLECGASVATEWGYEEHIFPNPRYTFFVKKRFYSYKSNFTSRPE